MLNWFQQTVERLGVGRAILLAGVMVGFGAGVTIGMAIGKWSR